MRAWTQGRPVACAERIQLETRIWPAASYALKLGGCGGAWHSWCGGVASRLQFLARRPIQIRKATSREELEDRCQAKWTEATCTHKAAS